MEKKINLERDQEGNILPTLRNKETVNNLLRECGSTEKLKEIMGEDYMKYIMCSMFDPRNKNVFFNTKEAAVKANIKQGLINQLDQAWLAEQK
jgi:hypothetical protein